ncbi:helix-turn-helix domain-containing protein [Paenibacillus physcomitrellae]|uniref:HTH-type transcriptional activator Btr n=1 Tax=Paenibacillus physcomitrellae TaxID=1619311 RepID=A0ABQ1FX54_9BACL|nr:helix-turn-helix domain-containing protein [Paenibacillus physcomitrellae]GGA33120.1 HTH-type transcriptional activator Btr [Paenibacillus physcomitrellae]
MNTSKPEHDFLQHTLIEIKEVRSSNDIPPWAASSEPLAHHTILYVSSPGQACLTVDGEQFPLEDETLYVFAPGSRIALASYSAADQKAEYNWTAFDLYRLAESSLSYRSYERVLDFPGVRQHAIGKKRFKRLFSAMRSGKDMPAAGPAGRSRLLAQQQLYSLLDFLLSAENEAEADMEDTLAKLKSSILFMQQHYAQDIRVDKLAELVQLHPSYYTQLFKQTMELTPVEYLTRLRMNKAKELLLQTDKSVREVAYEIGYEDEFYFSRRFKRTTGLAPTLYLKKKDFRIVSLSAPYTDHLYTLGLNPVAAQTYPGLPMEAPELDLPEHAADPWEVRRRIFKELKPDLILCKDNVRAQAMEHVNDLAPVISIPWATQDLYTHLSVIAGLTGREDEASQWIERHEQRSEELRKALKRRIGQASVAICVVRTTGLRMYGMRNIGHVFYRSLQLTPPERIARQTEPYPPGTHFNWTALPEHEIGFYEADYLLIAVSNTEEQARMERLNREHAAWAAHPAVRAGRVRFISWPKWKPYAPYAVTWQLEQAYRLLVSDGVVN